MTATLATSLVRCGFAIALIWCAPLQAEVYRWVDSNGNVHFSDEPGPGAETIEVPPTTTISLPKLSNENGEERRTESTQEEPYRSVSITFPSHNSAFHSGDGTFTVTTELQPPLSAAHELRLRLDGQVYARGQSGQFLLNNVDRGTHTLQLEVIQNDQVLQTSPETVFTLHRPSVLHPNRTKKP